MLVACECSRCCGRLVPVRTENDHRRRFQHYDVENTVVPLTTWLASKSSAAVDDQSDTGTDGESENRCQSLGQMDWDVDHYENDDFSPSASRSPSPNPSSQVALTGQLFPDSDSDPEEDPFPYDYDPDSIDAESDTEAAHMDIHQDIDESDQDVFQEEPMEPSRIDSVTIAQLFIEEIRSATLDNGHLDADTIDQLWNPPQQLADLSDPDTKMSLRIYLGNSNASQDTYDATYFAVHERYEDSEMLSYTAVQKLAASVTGITPIYDDCCKNICHVFAASFADLEDCYYCGEPRYDPQRFALTGEKVPQQRMCTLPLGPQLQALFRSEESAHEMRYRHEKTMEILQRIESLDPDKHGLDMVYDDLLCGSEYIDIANRVQITPHDILISSSIDGCQLYRDKKSDCWISIWIVNNFSPDKRYKKTHVLINNIIPGPNKPQNLDSFNFRGLQHLSALQRENNAKGISFWDASRNSLIQSRILFALATADAVGLADIDGRVGHHGAHGCRIGCSMKGRRKDRSGHYFAAHLQPFYCQIPDSNHPSIDIRNLIPLTPELYRENLAKVVQSKDQNEYEASRKETGISKPSIFDGLLQDHCFPLPRCFSLDLMHLIINIGELFMSLWRGTIKCESTDDIETWDWVVLIGDPWKNHGQFVADATVCFPSSFHRPPRNPAEKLNSGFKATEWYLYFFGLGPGFFRPLLPKKYYQNYCKLVRGFRTDFQRKLTGGQMCQSHTSLVHFVEEYEAEYYQGRMDRIHFCRPCIHTLLHLNPEAERVGPGAYSTQFTMERAIGDLGQQIRQPSNPYGNLAQIAVRQSQANALKALYPELDRKGLKRLPRGAIDMGDGYAVLRARTRRPITVHGAEGEAIYARFQTFKLTHWARLQLPNGQVARSLWKESLRSAGKLRISRMVKINIDDKIHYAEVRFFFLHRPNRQHPLSPYALVSVYSEPDQTILEDSCYTVHACRYLGDEDLKVVDAKSIVSVISMQKLPPLDGEPDDLWFVVEKSGLDNTELVGGEPDSV